MFIPNFYMTSNISMKYKLNYKGQVKNEYVASENWIGETINLISRSENVGSSRL